MSKILFETYLQSQFKSCPLTWVFHSRNTNNKINKLHERTRRLEYGDYSSTLQALCIELHKVNHNLSQTSFTNLIVRNHANYNLH